MRHVLLLGAITAGTHRMGQATAAARLVASAGGALAMATGLPRAAPRTIDLAAVAAAADQHLSLAADTQEQPAGRLGSLRLVRTWTTSVMGGILPPHTCSARCGARRRSQTSRFRSAPCLPCQSDRSSPHHCAPRGRHPKPTHRPRATACGYVDNARGVAHRPTGPASSSQYQFNCSGRAGPRPAETSRCAIFARIRIAIHKGCLGL
jgi:hypothetical protein